MVTLANLSNLSGRRALITGAAGGLGRVMSETLSELGANLVLVDIDPVKMNELRNKLIDQWRVEVECFICDLEQEEQRFDLMNRITSDVKNLNILINNAAFIGDSKIEGWALSLEKQSINTWRRALELNLTSIFDLCKGLSPIMKCSQGGSIINIASIYGLHGPDWSLYEGTEMGNPAAYAASKGGVIQLSRWLATTLAPNIRVNAISPGGIYRNQPQEFVRRYEAKTPLGRMACEDDFRGIVAFLATDLSQYVTGQNLIVDGGFSAW
jgi:NAD(P)-dependent dehydrogenase (short-subunit alcohol dehydrogenase family)